MTPELVKVSDDGGELVTIQFGNGHVTMHYSVAFKISQMIRMHAKKCKRQVGDVGQHWSVMGILEDANKRK